MYRSYRRRAPYRVVFYRTFRSVRYRYRCCIDAGTNSSTAVHIGTGGTGIDVEPNLPKCPVPVLMSYRAYRSVRYLYWRRTEFTEGSSNGNTGGIYMLGTYRTEHTLLLVDIWENKLACLFFMATLEKSGTALFTYRRIFLCFSQRQSCRRIPKKSQNFAWSAQRKRGQPWRFSHCHEEQPKAVNCMWFYFLLVCTSFRLIK